MSKNLDRSFLRRLNRTVRDSRIRFRRLSGRLGVLPDFIILGSQRCGTTSLYRHLCGHPSVVGALAKEVHFFDVNYDRGIGWYRAHFPRAAIGDDRQRRSFVTGEASPYYLFHPQAPRRVFEHVPDAKLIALLRNPIDRAHSFYQHQKRLGFEMLSFDEALAKETERLHGETEKLKKDGTYYSVSHNRFSYLAGGVYADQIDRWLEYFAKDQLLVIRSEDFFNDSAAVMRSVLDFLDLPHQEVNARGAYNVAEYEKLSPEIRQRLTDYFRPHNRRLYDLLETDFGWGS